MLTRARVFSHYAASFLLLAGCSWSRFVPLTPTPHATVPRTPADIEVFSSGPPTRPHVDVGLMEVWGREYSDIPAALREEGSKHGCDAVVLGSRMGSATCVVYGEPP
jgi:hypothetical protein